MISQASYHWRHMRQCGKWLTVKEVPMPLAAAFCVSQAPPYLQPRPLACPCPSSRPLHIAGAFPNLFFPTPLPFHAYSRFTHLSEELKECLLYNEPRVSLEIAAADISSLCSFGVVLFLFSVVLGTEPGASLSCLCDP